MNTSEFEEIPKKIDCTKNTLVVFIQVTCYPCMEVKQYPQSFVANVDTSEKPGTYWVAFYFMDDQHGEFFDSYGLPPQKYTKYFEDFLNATQWTYNKKHLQSLFTDVCGHFCIFYIYNRCNNVKMNTTVNMFPSVAEVKEDNDALVRYFVERKLVVGEIVKPLKLQCCKPLR